MPDQPFMDELLARLQRRHPGASFTRSGRSLTWYDTDHGNVVIVTSEDELAHAVKALGDETRDRLWPGDTIEQAGFNLLMVHVEEVLETCVIAGPLRIDASGVVWPDD